MHIFFSIEATVDALLMAMIGGFETLDDAFAGAAGIIEFLRHYLSELAMTKRGGLLSKRPFHLKVFIFLPQFFSLIMIPSGFS